MHRKPMQSDEIGNADARSLSPVDEVEARFAEIRANRESGRQQRITQRRHGHD